MTTSIERLRPRGMRAGAGRGLAWALLAGASALLLGCGGSEAPVDVAAQYKATALVSNGTQTPKTDANLAGGWGVAFNPAGVVWVNTAGTSKSTLYDGDGTPQALVVSVPSGTTGTAARPTGIVFNPNADFRATEGGLSGAAPFIFATDNGTLSAWSPGVNRLNALLAVDNSARGAAYTGLALLPAADSLSRLYAADFRNGRIDVFGANFQPVTVAGGFRDSSLPEGYAPFGIQQIDGKLFVSYARRDATGRAPLREAGRGLLKVFDAQGNLLASLAGEGGVLNAPWGMAKAPANFGAFSGKLLVGNFGDGRIHAFDPATGALAGVIGRKSDREPLVREGLLGIAFGNDRSNQPSNTLFYATSQGNHAQGTYGRIDLD